MDRPLTGRPTRFVAVLALVVVLAGCTATTPEAQVATMAAPSSGASTPGLAASGQTAGPSGAASTSPAGSAPRERLDMTSDEIAALSIPLDECLAAQGLTGKSAQDAAAEADYDSAIGACQDLIPLPPWETDRSNPDARAFVQAVVDCLHGKGIEYVEIADDPTSPTIDIALGGPNNDSDSITRGMELIPECQREASAAQ